MGICTIWTNNEFWAFTNTQTLAAMSLANRINIVLFSLLFFYTKAVSQNQDSLISFKPNIDWALFKGVETDDTSSAAISTSIKLEVARVSIWLERLFSGHMLS